MLAASREMSCKYILLQARCRRRVKDPTVLASAWKMVQCSRGLDHVRGLRKDCRSQKINRDVSKAQFPSVVSTYFHDELVVLPEQVEWHKLARGKRLRPRAGGRIVLGSFAARTPFYRGQAVDSKHISVLFLSTSEIAVQRALKSALAAFQAAYDRFPANVRKGTPLHCPHRLTTRC